MSQVLRQSTQIIVRIGPFVDVTDGFTPETGITLGAADEAELLKANTTTTTDISGATFAAITGCDGWYGLTLTTSLTDTVGPLDVMVNDDSVCLPVFARFQVIEEAAYDAMYAASADPKADINVGSLDADVINDNAIAADAVLTIRHATYGVADSGTTTTFVDAALTQAATDYWKGLLVQFYSGNAAGQSRLITAFDPATDTITFTPAVTGAIGTDTYGITPWAGADLRQILGTTVSTPATAGILDVNVKNIDNDAASASGTVTFPNATLASTTNITAGTITTATNVTTVNGLAANVITAASMAADASAEIADAVWDEDATGHQTQGTFGQAIGDPVADANTIFKAVVTDATGATVGVDVVAVTAETASIQTDTNDIQARLPAALTADGNIKADTLRVGGTLQTAGDIIGDTNDIQARLPAALTAGGNMKSDMLALNGGTQSAADLKDFADDGYDPATNKVQGVVLTDTVTTYTGNTVQTGDSFARLGAPAGASVSADIADVEGKVDDLESRLGTPSDLGSGATVAANLADIEGQTDNLPGIETKIDAIQAKTDNLPSDPADQSLIIAATTAIVADTEDIQARLPAALLGGRMDSSVGAMANGTVTAAAVATGAIDADALAADAANEIRDAVFARAFSAAYGSHTFDELVKMIAVALLGKVSGMDTNAPVFRNIADNADVITATTDADGNRSAVTLTP